MTPEAIIAEATQRLVAQFAPQAVFLFGSRAAERATADSDFDLFVVLPDGADARIAPGLMRRALLGLPAAFDIVVANAAPWRRWSAVPATMEHRVATQGVALYGG